MSTIQFVELVAIQFFGYIALSLIGDVIERRVHRGIAELNLVESAAERKEVWEAARRRDHNGSWEFLGTATLFLPVLVGGVLLLGLCRLSPAFGLLLVVAVVVFLVVGHRFLLARFMRRRLTRSLRRELIERGIPVCMQCGYCLRGLEASECPECGRAVEQV